MKYVVYSYKVSVVIFLIYVGALTLHSTSYSYRAWEYERIESYDPFDASGAKVVYYVHGVSIFKVQTLINSHVAWCTDKVRNFIDCVNFNFYIASSLVLGLSLIFILTWSEVCRAVETSFAFFILIGRFSKIRYTSAMASDNYSNARCIMMLTHFVEIFRSFHMLRLDLYLYSMFIFDIGLFVTGLLTYLFHRHIVFYISYMKYNYPYLYLTFSNGSNATCIVGVLTDFNFAVKNFYINYYSFVFFFKNLFFMSPKRFYVMDIHMVIVQSYLGIYFKSYIKQLSSLHNCYDVCVLYLNKYNLNVLLTQYTKLRKLFCYASPYSYFYMCLFSSRLMLDQGYPFEYIGLAVDSGVNTHSQSISIQLTSYSYLVDVNFDLLIPIGTFLQLDSIYIDYYGYVEYALPVCAQPNLISINFFIKYCLSATINYRVFNYWFLGIPLIAYAIIQYCSSFYVSVFLLHNIRAFIEVGHQTATCFFVCLSYFIDAHSYLLTGRSCLISKAVSLSLRAGYSMRSFL